MHENVQDGYPDETIDLEFGLLAKQKRHHRRLREMYAQEMAYETEE